MEIWPALASFEAELRAEGLWTHETICVGAARLLELAGAKPYRHIIVDKAQDLSPWQSLAGSGIPAISLAKRATRDGEVAAATMHRMKGLEFRYVAVVGVGEHHVPAPSAVTPATDDQRTHDLDIQRERCLLFVAPTRARENLVVSWHGTPSRLLPT